jgi:hypothetical protein
MSEIKNVGQALSWCNHQLQECSSSGSNYYQSLFEVRDILAKLAAVNADYNIKITTLTETIDSQHLTNLALVNKLEVAEKEADEYKSLYNNALTAGSDFERLHGEKVMRKVKLEKQVEGLQSQVTLYRPVLERARIAFINLIDLKLLPSPEYEKVANNIAGDIFMVLSDIPAEATEQLQALIGQAIDIWNQSKSVRDRSEYEPLRKNLDQTMDALTKYRGEA